MKRLSVIIPVYNGEKCLPRLVESLQSQDIPMEDYELLFVDDCSTDDSVSLIERYKERFSNIRLVRHEKNLRLATACNTGLDNAQGNYLWFVDQDDRVEVNCMEFLLRAAECQGLNLLLFNYKRMNQSGEVIDVPMVFDDTDVMDGESYIRKYFSKDFDDYLLGFRWRSLFSRKYLLEEKIRFLDGMMYDDTTFLLKSILWSRRVASVSGYYYLYYVNDESITYAKGKKGERIFEFAFLVGNEVSDFAGKVRSINLSWADVLKKRAKKYYNGFVIDLARTSREERNRFYECVRNHSVIVDDVKSEINGVARLLLLPLLGRHFAALLSWIYKIKHNK